MSKVRGTFWPDSGSTGNRAKYNSDGPKSLGRIGYILATIPTPVSLRSGVLGWLEEWARFMQWVDLGTADKICAHFASCYHDMVMRWPTGPELAIGRRLIHAHARKALVENLQWPEEDAVDLAHQLIGLDIGAKLPPFPDIFTVIPKIIKKMGGVEAAKVARSAHIPPPQPCPAPARQNPASAAAKADFQRPKPKDDSWCPW